MPPHAAEAATGFVKAGGDPAHEHASIAPPADVADEAPHESVEVLDRVRAAQCAGGGTLAYALAPTGKRILLLERGEFVPREKDNWSPRAVNVEGKYQTKETWRDKDGKELHPHTNYWVGGNTKVLRRRVAPPAQRRLRRDSPPRRGVWRRISKRPRAETTSDGRRGFARRSSSSPTSCRRPSVPAGERGRRVTPTSAPARPSPAASATRSSASGKSIARWRSTSKTRSGPERSAAIGRTDHRAGSSEERRPRPTRAALDILRADRAWPSLK